MGKTRIQRAASADDSAKTVVIKDRTALMIHFRNPGQFKVAKDGTLEFYWNNEDVFHFTAAQIQAETGEEWEA